MWTVLLGEFTGAWVRLFMLVIGGPFTFVGSDTFVVPVEGPLTAVTKVVNAGVSPGDLVTFVGQFYFSTTTSFTSTFILTMVPTVTVGSSGALFAIPIPEVV